MLWLIFRILVFVAIVVGLAFGVSTLLDTSGGVTINWDGKTYQEVHPLLFATLLLVTLAGLWVLFKLVGLLIAVIRFLTGDETALSRFWGRWSQKRGLTALSNSMISLAAGDGKKAMTYAKKAERWLDNPDLTRLVNAQAAEMAGDKARAETYYLAMSRDEDTEFVGLKGLLEQAMADGDDERALKIARKAATLDNAQPNVLVALFDLQTKSGDWRSARDTIKAERRAGLLTGDVATRRDAVLSLGDALAAHEEGDTERAKTSVLAAVKRSPGLVPAAGLAAEILTKEGATKKAERIVIEAWRYNPHPSLAGHFAALEPEETPQARSLRFDKLTGANPRHLESVLLNAELAIASEDWGRARQLIAPVLENRANARACAIMAAVERGEGGDEAVVRAWLARAVTAPRGPQWICSNCKTPAAAWSPACEECGAFDSLEWIDQPDVGSSAADAIMLPLTMGTIEGGANAEEPMDVEAETPVDEASADAAPQSSGQQAAAEARAS